LTKKLVIFSLLSVFALLLLSSAAAALIAAVLLLYQDDKTAFAAFPVKNLNQFYLPNETSDEQLFTVLGQFMNNGTETEKEVDLSLTMFDKYGEIVGVAYYYNYDVKPNDTLPFRFRVPASLVEDGNFSAITSYDVIVD
jgi:hypothetical protein